MTSSCLGFSHHAGQECWLEDFIKQWVHSGWNLDLVLPDRLVLCLIKREGWAGFELVFTTQNEIRQSVTNSEFLQFLNASVWSACDSHAKNYFRCINLHSFRYYSIGVRNLRFETFLTLELYPLQLCLFLSLEAWRTSLHYFWSLRAKQQQEAGKAMIHCKLCLTDCPELDTSTLQSCNCVFCVQVRALLNSLYLS